MKLYRQQHRNFTAEKCNPFRIPVFLSKWIHESDSHSLWTRPHGTTRHGSSQHGTTSDFSAILTTNRPWTFRSRACLPFASWLVVTSQEARTIRCRVKVLFDSLQPLTAETRAQSVLDLWYTKWRNWKVCCWWMSVYSSGVWGLPTVVVLVRSLLES